ncbi:MAG: hypothetical protein ACKO96_02085, partial [Flammeovirgaceae bacterium]
YARIENDQENPDFITGNQIARIGLVENPQVPGGALLTSDKASAVYALRLVGSGYSTATFVPDSFITQTVGTGKTASGRVISYNQLTGVLKYWQDKTLAGFNTVGTGQSTTLYGYDLLEFANSISPGGSFIINGGSTP